MDGGAWGGGRRRLGPQEAWGLFRGPVKMCSVCVYVCAPAARSSPCWHQTQSHSRAAQLKCMQPCSKADGPYGRHHGAGGTGWVSIKLLQAGGIHKETPGESHDQVHAALGTLASRGGDGVWRPCWSVWDEQQRAVLPFLAAFSPAHKAWEPAARLELGGGTVVTLGSDYPGQDLRHP